MNDHHDDPASDSQHGLAHEELTVPSLPELGRLRPPYPREGCAAAHCQQQLDEEIGAYLFTDLDSRKLVVFCGDCARHVELNCRTRFALVAL